MSKSIISALLLVLTFSGVAYAEDTKSEGESAMKIEDATDKKNEVPGDVDEEVTNAKLRAESGSKSKYSGSIQASYYGGSLEKPLDNDRPNPTNDPVPERVSLYGEANLRYRMDKNQSLTGGTGFYLQRPLQEAKRGSVSDPYVKYNYVGKIGMFQNVADFGPTLYTKSDEVDAGKLGYISASNTTMTDFNGSKLSLGMALEAYAFAFTKNHEMVDLYGTQAPAYVYQEDFQIAPYPIIEYAFSDKIQLRTVFRPWIFGHNRGDNANVWVKRPWTQSIGVGYAVTRDIYLYPNFQYDWEKWRRDDYNWFRKDTRAVSTVGLSATVNVF